MQCKSSGQLWEEAGDNTRHPFCILSYFQKISKKRLRFWKGSEEASGTWHCVFQVKCNQVPMSWGCTVVLGEMRRGPWVSPPPSCDLGPDHSGKLEATKRFLHRMYYRNGGVYLPVLYAKEIRLQPSQTILASQNYLAQQSEVHTRASRWDLAWS